MNIHPFILPSIDPSNTPPSIHPTVPYSSIHPSLLHPSLHPLSIPPSIHPTFIYLYIHPNIPSLMQPCLIRPSIHLSLPPSPYNIHLSLHNLIISLSIHPTIHPFLIPHASIQHPSIRPSLQHKYVSIAEVQMKREEELQQCPLTLVSSRL